MRWIFIVALAVSLDAQSAPPTGRNVLLVVNRNSDISLRIGVMYAARRGVPPRNICRLLVTPEETVDRATFLEVIEKPLIACLQQHPRLADIRYLLTTKGVPLRISGEGGRESDRASVDSELTLLPRRLRGEQVEPAGRVPNPYFGRYREAFNPAALDFYPVTRLTGYSYEDIEALIDRSLAAENRGLFVLDIAPIQPDQGNQWLKRAARALPLDRVILDNRNDVLYGQKAVIGYASWGSNDAQRAVDKKRFLGFDWLPGAVAIEYVSTNARTFAEPPADWTIGSWQDEPETFFAASPQTMTGDLVREGVTGTAGHVFEPYLNAVPRPDYVLPAYFDGKPLAEAFYLGIPFLSWMNIVIGDPLCRLG